MKGWSLITPRTFWLRVERDPSGCWLWHGKRGSTGYGWLTPTASRTETATHRYAYRLVHGLIPAGLMVCHTCDVRHCVNPAHLYAGTRSQNMRDMVARGRRSGIPNMSEGEVLEARRRRATGESYLSIAKSIGFARETIRRACIGQSHQHV